MKVPKKKIVSIIREILDEEGLVQVRRTDEGLIVVDVPGSDAKAVFDQAEAKDLLRKLQSLVD